VGKYEKNKHKRDLRVLFDKLTDLNTEEKISNYFDANSNLPGRRANSELATTFAEVIADSINLQKAEKFWQFCDRLIKFSVKKPQ